MKKQRFWAVVLMGLLLLTVIAGCQSQTKPMAQSEPEEVYYTTGRTLKAGNSELIIDVTDESGQPMYINDTSAVTQQVIRQASVSLEVEDMEGALQTLQTIADASQGFIQSASRWESGGGKRANYTIRIPATNFMTALSDIQNIGKVVRSDNSAQDVTEEYIDLAARLHTLEAKEETYLGLFDKAKTIEDILRIEEELDRVVYEIERTKGRIQYLERNVSMSTITVQISEKQPTPTEMDNFSAQLKYAMQDGFGAMVQFLATIIRQIVWLLPFIPFVLLIYFVIRLIIKAIKKRRRDWRKPPEDQI